MQFKLIKMQFNRSLQPFQPLSSFDIPIKAICKFSTCVFWVENLPIAISISILLQHRLFFCLPFENKEASPLLQDWIFVTKHLQWMILKLLTPPFSILATS
jgi:hypothetical protein